MDEIHEITKKYDAEFAPEGLTSVGAVNGFALTFYKDVAEIYDCLTRLRNKQRNATGFSLDDAPVLGLLVRIWKLLKEVIRYYELDNAEIIGILERPLIEAAVVAKYLMTQDANVMQDYRKCSYKNRLRILRDLEAGSAFFESKAGQRLLASAQEKLALEGFEPGDFEDQKNHRWRLQNKNFSAIFAEVENDNLYACTYGMMSESIHGSWLESVDWRLYKNQDGSFSVNPFYHSADIRYVSPILRFTNQPYRLWMQRIDTYDESIAGLLDWIESVNAALFKRFDSMFEG